MPNRRSIWEVNEEYAPPPERADDLDLQLIGLIQSIEAAKKRTPPIPVARLTELAEKLRAPPDPLSLDAEGFAVYVEALRVYGVGIKTAVCMLAVTSKGAFSPMDEKLAAGLVKLGFVTPDDAKVLNGANVESFATVYVQNVMPRWRDARCKGEPPHEIDKRWTEGRHDT